MLAKNREDGGKLVRKAWLDWCQEQQVTKESWLLPWEKMDDWDREFDRRIWDEITAPYHTMIAELVSETQRLRRTIAILRDDE